jgi:hypothetical protein
MSALDRTFRACPDVSPETVAKALNDATRGVFARLPEDINRAIARFATTQGQVRCGGVCDRYVPDSKHHVRCHVCDAPYCGSCATYRQVVHGCHRGSCYFCDNGYVCMQLRHEVYCPTCWDADDLERVAYETSRQTATAMVGVRCYELVWDDSCTDMSD